MFILDITKDISSEILIIYLLIALVIGLIVIIAVLDKKEKKRINMTKTQELKLLDLRKADEEYIEEYKLAKKEELDEVYEEEKKVKKERYIENIDIDDNMYVPDDLEKTTAQLKLEELTRELEKVQQREEDKISRFEQEQEENAIISYHELLKVSTKLYENNDKTQYQDEGNEPITIDQLRSRFAPSSSSNLENIEVL